MTARVLIAGVPRSGTTWVGQVLRHTGGAAYVHEPDNHLVRPEAWWAKRGLGSYPALRPGQEARDYERLWALAFDSAPGPSLLRTGARLVHRCVPRAERRAVHDGAGGALGGALRLAGALATRHAGTSHAGATVVKSVFCARSLEWVADRFSPDVVVMERHPFSVIGSWAELGWDSFLDREPEAVRYCRAAFGVAPPPPGAPWIERAAWHWGFLTSVLGEAAARHPEWQVVRHEQLCAAPLRGFRAICARSGLEWTTAAERFLAASNRPGHGYSTNRVWAQQLEARHRRLEPALRERALEVLDLFPAHRRLAVAAGV